MQAQGYRAAVRSIVVAMSTLTNQYRDQVNVVRSQALPATNDANGGAQ
jgi:hypothetical protein